LLICVTLQFSGHEFQVDAIDGAGFDAQFAARAFDGNHGMHVAGCAEYRIDRAGLQALRTADTGILGYDRNRLRLLYSVCRIKSDGSLAKQAAESLDRRFAARRTLVDFCRAGSERFGIRPTAGKSALTALRLRQEIIDLIDRTVARGVQSRRGNSQSRCYQRSKTAHYDYCHQHTALARVNCGLRRQTL
jgi:hypothetical protein